MKIIIDPAGIIEDEEYGDILYRETQYPLKFEEVVQKILTPSQYETRVSRGGCVFNISKLRMEVLLAIAKEEHDKNK